MTKAEAPPPQRNPPQHNPSAGISPQDRPLAEIDARDLLCPLPVLRLRKALAGLAPGQSLRLLATDPASWIDVPHFCAEQGHDLLAAEDRDGLKTYLVRRG